MIERGIRTWLRDSAAIQGIVGVRIYGGNAPRGVGGAYILLRRIISTHIYDLSGEVGLENPIVQIDCYEASKTAADTLAEAVRNRISGFRGFVGGIDVQTCQFIRDTTLEVPPADASDQWVYLRSMDLELFSASAVPDYT